MAIEEKLYRDYLGGVVPQFYNEVSKDFTVLAIGDFKSVNIGMTRLLRDKLGGVIPNQVLDVASMTWVVGEPSGGGGTGGGGTVKTVNMVAPDSTGNINLDVSFKGYPDASMLPTQRIYGQIIISDGTIYSWNDTNMKYEATANIIGPRGERGLRGEGFDIKEVFPSEAAMNAYSGSYLQTGDLVIISTENPQDPENSRVFIYDGTKFNFINDLSGAIGINGENGEKGEKGDVGPSLNIRGRYDNVSQLPSTGVLGESYWIGSKLYVWSNDPLATAIPGYVDSNDLRGLKGDKGDGLKFDGTGTSVGSLPNPNTNGATYIIDGVIYVYDETTGDYIANGNVKGEQGTPGVKGDKGDKGDQGAQGLKGDAGQQGIQGLKGDKGDAGTEGIQGPQGQQGIPGLRGEKGEKGDQGIQGSQGLQGNEGPQGEQGSKGEMGDGLNVSRTYPSIAEMNANYATDGIALDKFVIIGNPLDEADIDNGKIYKKGATAYEYITDLKGLPGIKGDDGPQGIQGPRGIDGIEGPRGLQGLQGLQGPQGLMGAQGLQGVRGIQGIQGLKGEPGEGVPNLGAGPLKTDAQTILEAINEVFQNGNNVKQATVDALLSKDSTLPITSNSTWLEIQTAIDLIKIGGVNGELENVTVHSSISAGDFVKLQKEGVGTYTWRGNVNYSNFYKTDAVQIGDDKVLISFEGAGETLYISLLQFKDDIISLLYTVQVSAGIRSGDGSNLCKLSDESVIISFNGTGSAPAYELWIRAIKITGNTLSFPSNGSHQVTNVAKTGEAHKALRISNTKFLIMHNNGALIQTTMRIFEVNPAGSFLQLNGTGSESIISQSTALLYQAEILNESDNVFLITALDTNKALYSYVIRVNATNNTITKLREEFGINTGSNTGWNHKLKKITTIDGSLKFLLLFNFVANNSISARVIEYDNTDYSFVNSPTSINIINVANSGGEIGYRKNLYDVIELRDGYFHMVYRNGNNLHSCKLDTNIVPLKTFEDRIIYTGINYTRIPQLFKFKNGGFGLLRGELAATHGYADIVPETNIRIAKKGEVIYGVAQSNGAYPNSIDVKVPFN